MTDSCGQLLIERRGEIAWVTIDRAADRNSINSALMADIEGALAHLEAEGLRAVVFTGAGGTYFIGGADGVEMMRLSSEQAHDFSVRIQDLFNRLEASPLVTAAAINGLCFGGGYEFAMACDLRVAAASARIGLPEVKVGLIPGGGGTQRLPRLIGLGRALELILSGRLVRPDEAEKLGMIHLAVADGDLEAGVARLLDPILKQPAYAVALAKRAVYASTEGSMRRGLMVESERFSRCFERTFFAGLMARQLKEGKLQTSEDVSDVKGEQGQ
jgi:enoyl-CoA hydratase/carnithine racemase